MGFKGLMTNSLILYTRRREEALESKIHRLLGFDGIMMTDSGGYQVLEYGDVDVSYGQIATFQSEIGSNLAVTLDRPTGYSLSRSYATETMEYSLKNAVATIREFGNSETVWVGPVQGGLFADLLRKSATELTEAGFKFLALGSPTEVMESYRFTELLRMITASRKAIPYSMPLHLFGAGHPLTMAMSVALGCDTFDSASYILFARQGRYMTERGILRLEQMSYLPCSCPTCEKTSVRDLLDMGGPERSRLLGLHNLRVLKAEIDSCKQAIAEGRLWDLVEEKAAAHPRLYEAFRAFTAETDILRQGTPALKERGLFVRGELDLMRPELSTASGMLSGALKRKNSTALLVVSGESLPAARLSFRVREPQLKDCDVYLVHPILGAYPVELDFVYPFTQTVSAVNVASPDGVRKARYTLKRMGYRRVVAAFADEKGSVSLVRAKSRRTRKAVSPSPPSTSSRPR